MHRCLYRPVPSCTVVFTVPSRQQNLPLPSNIQIFNIHPLPVVSSRPLPPRSNSGFSMIQGRRRASDRASGGGGRSTRAAQGRHGRPSGVGRAVDRAAAGARTTERRARGRWYGVVIVYSSTVHSAVCGIHSVKMWYMVVYATVTCCVIGAPVVPGRARAAAPPEGRFRPLRTPAHPPSSKSGAETAQGAPGTAHSRRFSTLIPSENTYYGLQHPTPYNTLRPIYALHHSKSLHGSTAVRTAVVVV